MKRLLASTLLVSACATTGPSADDPTPWPRPTPRAEAPAGATGGRAPASRAPAKTMGAPTRAELFAQQRAKAYEPRRFKAVFKGEISQKVGAAVRGYLSIFWDGESLLWKTSAPVAGEGQAGHLSLKGWGGTERAPFPGRVTPRDAIGALLGIPDLAPQSVNPSGEVLLGEDRFAEVDDQGRPVKLAFPGGCRGEPRSR